MKVMTLLDHCGGENKMFPKKKYKSKNPKPKRNPVPTENDLCDVCLVKGIITPYAHCHEIFFGEKHRKWSILYSLTKRLCYEHHQGELGPHKNRQRDLELKKESQARFEEEYSHELFMQLFGRNYI